MSIMGLRNRIGPYDRGTFRTDVVNRPYPPM